MSDDRIVFECPIAEEVALNDLAEPGQQDEQLSTNETTTDKDNDDRIIFEENMPIEEPINEIKSNSIQEGTPEQQSDDDLSSDGGRKLKYETWRTQPAAANDEDDLTSDGGRKLKNTTLRAQSASYTESAPPAEEDRIVYEE